MDYSRYPPPEVERRGDVLKAIMGRPDSLDAISTQLHTDVACVFADIAQDEAWTVIFMDERARFGDTHVTAGLVAGDGAFIWPWLIDGAREAVPDDGRRDRRARRPRHEALREPAAARQREHRARHCAGARRGSFTSQEHKEGMATCIEKRQPSFSGR